jgi:hypothetical protein
MQTSDGVRAAVEAVDGAGAQLARRAAAGGEGPVSLRASWTRLVELLALGPPARLRSRPHWGATGLEAATRRGARGSAPVPPMAAAGPRPADGGRA